MSARITRLEFGTSAGYQVVIGKGGKGRTVYFSDLRHGSKRKAHTAAKEVCHALNVLLEHLPEVRLCR